MLATSLYDIVSKKYDVIKASKEELDITNYKNVREIIVNYRPKYIIHTASLTNVDLCEEDKKLAMNVNCIGTKNIAKCANIVNSKLVYISTCGLFGDEIKEYSEEDEVTLKTEYSKSKYAGENVVKKLCSEYYIIRPGWLFGGNINHRKNFVYNRYLEAQKKDVLISAGDKFGCPTYTSDLCDKIMELLETDKFGTYHISNRGSASRYLYVKKIIETFKLKNVVLEKDSTYFKRSAPVPDCEIIQNRNLQKDGFQLLPEWEDAIERYIYKLKLKVNI